MVNPKISALLISLRKQSTPFVIYIETNMNGTESKSKCGRSGIVKDWTTSDHGFKHGIYFICVLAIFLFSFFF